VQDEESLQGPRKFVRNGTSGEKSFKGNETKQRGGKGPRKRERVKVGTGGKRPTFGTNMGGTTINRWGGREKPPNTKRGQVEPHNAYVLEKGNRIDKRENENKKSGLKTNPHFDQRGNVVKRLGGNKLIQKEKE